MSIQEDTIHYLSPQSNPKIRATIHVPNLSFDEPYYDYDPNFPSQCLKICSDPANTKLMCIINDEDLYLFVSDPAAHIPVQTTSEESEAAQWSIVQKEAGDLGPIQEIQLLNAEGHGTGLYLLGAENRPVDQVYLGEQSNDLNWLMDTAAVADWYNTAVLLHSQEDDNVISSPAEPGNAMLETAEADNPLQVMVVKGAADGGEAEKVPVMIGSYQLLGLGSGEAVTCGPDTNDHYWNLTDDGYGNITIQCVDASQNNIGWLEKTGNGVSLNEEKSEKKKQKWKFSKSTTGLIET